MSDSVDQRLSSYDFHLPEERIAQRPVEPRHAARLLVVEPAPELSSPFPCRHLTVWDLQHELRPGDLLVVNNTRVLKARLQARRPSGGAVELLVLEPLRVQVLLQRKRRQRVLLPFLLLAQAPPFPLLLRLALPVG